jgi:arginyl-tRNA synthetase
MRQEIQSNIAAVVKDLFNLDVDVELTRPDEQFGDYATNVALQIAGKLNKNPRDIATEIADHLQSQEYKNIENVETAGPGFLNIKLSDAALWSLSEAEPTRSLENKTVVAEYSDPNPFKVLHAGHLYTSVVGDAIAKLLEVAGAKVYRVNFGGDVGLHVAKNMWAIVKNLGAENPDKLSEVGEEQRADWLSERYVEGNEAYENDESAKAEIITLNKRIYQLHADNDHDSPFAQIYWTTRQWSYDYFDNFYARIGSRFDKYYPESETAPIGLATVREHVPDVYEESDEAIVFKGEPYGLHTRVFINSEGLPTYEAKDVGLIMKKWDDYHFDRSVVITGNDIVEYMKVVLKSIEQFAPNLTQATTHLTHGIVKLAGGEKMSSRKGNVLRAVDVLEAAAKANEETTGNKNEQTVLAAVKYAFLKQRIGADIVYDPKEAVSILGNSGPYLQYAHARARSILAKSQGSSIKSQDENLEPDERSLLRKIGEFSEAVDSAVQELLPSHITTYLYELAQVFNRFYEHNRVIDDARQDIRLQLVNKYADTLKSGLELLNIPAPEKM